MILTSAFNLFLRLLVTGSKFLLIIYIAKYFPTQDLGTYSLFSTSVSLGIILIGFDFYNYSIREIVKDKNNISKYFLNQIIFHKLSYIVVTAMCIILYAFNIVPLYFLLFFIPILVCEHLTQEFYRLFIAIKKPITANIILFIRAGAWILLILLLWSLNLCPKNITTVWIMWFIGSFSATIISILKFYKIFSIKIRKESIDWIWLKKGIRTGLIFFIGTLFYKVIEFSDRYIIDILLSRSDVGIYSFYTNIANLLNTIVFTSTIIIYYPRILETKYSNRKAYKQNIRNFFLSTVVISSISAVFLILSIHPLVRLINKTNYIKNIDVFYIIVAGNVILNFSFIPHYILYALNKDKLILYSTGIAAVLNIILNIILVKRIGITGAAIATLISFIIIAITKSLWSFKIEKHTNIL